jgi:serine O-acetyltransferase
MNKTLLEDNKIFTIVYNTLADNLFEYANIVNPIRQHKIAESLATEIEKDRDALREKDPAAKLFAGEKGDEYVLSYKSLEAVIMYRIFHYIYNFKETDFDYSDTFQIQANKLSNKTKVDTSVEIHPAAKIGQRFVIDHGCATVIGETCEIGDNCYILHGVTLGATKISDNPTGRRHPKLGNNVEVGGFARLFGAITIGNNTKINGYTVIDRNIPENKIVSVINQVQLCHNKKGKDVPIENTDTEAIVIYGLRPHNDYLEIIGKNLNCCNSIELLKSDSDNIEYFSTTINKKSDDTSLFFSIDDVEKIIENENIEQLKLYQIAVRYNDKNILLANSVGWNDYIKNKISRK